MLEPDGFYERYADPAIRERLSRAAGRFGWTAARRRRSADPRRAPHARARVGRADRRDAAQEPRRARRRSTRATAVAALDRMGFQSQLIFTSSFLNLLTELDRGDDEELSLGATRAHNRGVRRLLQRRRAPAARRVGAVRRRSSGRSRSARESIDAGAAALMIPSRCPRRARPDPHRLRPAVGDGAGGGGADRVPRRRRPADGSRRTSATACRR